MKDILPRTSHIITFSRKLDVRNGRWNIVVNHKKFVAAIIITLTSQWARLLNCLFRYRSKKTSKLRVPGLFAENSPGTGEFSAQKASDAEKVFIWWRHHVICKSTPCAIWSKGCTQDFRDKSLAYYFIRWKQHVYSYCFVTSGTNWNDHDDVINGNIFRVTGHLCGEFTGDRWIPRTKASDAELWRFLWSASK